MELNSEYPDSEDIQEEFKRVMSNLRENLADLEILFRKMINGETFLSKEETAKLLKCTEDTLPRKLCKYHVGRNFIYKVSDIYDFVESKKLGGL